MATTVTGAKPLTKKGKSLGGRPGFPGGNGDGSGKRNGNEGHFSQFESSADRYRIGMWIALAAILMMFTALTSAYIVRAASSTDWRPIAMPQILLLSTALIITSSGTIEVARRKLKAALEDSYNRWLFLTAALGVAFVVSQLLAWRKLVRQGVYVASNPHSSFFYLLTATHGVHLLGGLIALIYLLLRTRLTERHDQALAKQHAVTDAVTLYWHFMDGLWIYLFLLLFFWR
ncbi:MAG: cytochrome c oxidase subunit 3 [Pyrinomonadaceae bacterium]|nr:cytochrome c oxidase subunit 3 [Pyrinomonadaceae bacterium]